MLLISFVPHSLRLWVLMETGKFKVGGINA